jgi:3-methylfumaryl-CoA hydratase
MSTDPTQPAAQIDLNHLRQWIGPVQTLDDTLSLRHAQLMAATLDRPDLPLAEGSPLPLLWHWLYFLEGRPRSELGTDGHPARGGFLPPVPLPNRMWAGGRVSFEAPLPIGSAVQKRSQVLKVEHKLGRTGDLVFVTVQHELWAQGQCCIREEQDLVYKAPTPPAVAQASAAEPAPAPGAHVRPYAPDATMLFRYSALTFNGHRIHYDRRYVTEVEGYPGLVVHGPLIATLLLELLHAHQPGAEVAAYRFKALRPCFDGRPLHICGRPEGAGVRLWATDHEGALAMDAEATLR